MAKRKRPSKKLTGAARTKAIAKVKKVLRAGIHTADASKSGLVRGATVAFDHDYVLVRLKNGKWCGKHGGGEAFSIGGCIGGDNGFDIYAQDTAEMLVHLRMVTKAEAEAFHDWSRGALEKSRMDSDIRRMKELAQQYGYTVSKGK